MRPPNPRYWKMLWKIVLIFLAEFDHFVDAAARFFDRVSVESDFFAALTKNRVVKVDQRRGFHVLAD